MGNKHVIAGAAALAALWVANKYVVPKVGEGDGGPFSSGNLARAATFVVALALLQKHMQ